MRVLQSKLQPPKRPGILHRKRLTRIFEEIGSRKLTTVLAGAGFGKTTLVIDALSHMDIAPAWYRLDQQDMDFHVFLSYLYSMVDQQLDSVDKIGEPLKLPNPGIQNQTAVLTEWLGFLQAGVRHPAAIILDDYHLVQENARINQAIDFILPRLPGHIHLIIIGRKKLPLALSRLRAQDQLIEVNEENLAFSNSEIKSFFLCNPMITQEDIDGISKLTGGWAASLVLLRYTFGKHAQKSIPESLALIRKRPEYIFSYLKETIFDTQPDHVRHFMMKASLLPEITTGQCERIFQVKHARLLLQQMLEDHLLIFPVDDSGEIFYLHHLFRDFLREELNKTYSASQVCDLHCRIGEITEPQDAFQALYHFVEGRDFKQAVRIIKENEMKFLLGGKINFLGRQIEKIPEQILKDSPQLLLSLSRLHSHYGDPDKAIQLIVQALKLFKQQKAKDQMISCVIELGSQYYYSGHLKEAKLMMEQVLDDISPQSQTYVLAMTYLIFFCSVLGDFQGSEKHYQDARKAVSGHPDFEKKMANALFDTSLSHTLYFAGEFERSQQLCKTLLRTVLKLNIEPCLPLVYYQLSANSCYLGEYRKGCGYARKGIEACEKMSLADSRKAWVYLAWAQNSLGLEDFDEVFDKINESTSLFEQPGNRWGLASTWDCLAAAYLAQKKTALAKKTLEKGLEMISGHGLRVTQSILENTLSKALLDEGKYQDGLETLLASRPHLKGAAYHLFNNYLLSARALAGLGSLEEACRQTAEAVGLSMVHSYDLYIVKERAWIIPLLKKAANIFYGFGPGVRPYFEMLYGSELRPDPDLLKICLLGPFTVSIKGTDIPLSDWKSAKSLMILKFLAANHGQGYIHRERLMELLWPEQDPDKTAARFNMAMSTLRKTLEPDLSPKAASAYIDRKKDTYRLFDDKRIDIDAQSFSSLLSKGFAMGDRNERFILCLLDAIDLYQGDFLEQDPYEEWCIEKREAFSKDYESALQAVIRIFEREKNWAQAVFYAEKLFKKNPLDEAAVEKLMIFYAKTGRFSKAKHTYDAHARAARQLGLPISEKLSACKSSLVKI